MGGAREQTFGSNAPPTGTLFSNYNVHTTLHTHAHTPTQNATHIPTHAHPLHALQYAYLQTYTAFTHAHTHTHRERERERERERVYCLYDTSQETKTY